MNPHPSEVLAQARKEIRQETFRAAVDAEKARLRAHRTLGQRLAALLPFTITWKSK